MKKKITKYKYIRYFWILYISSILLFILALLFASWGVFGKMPTFEQLENPRTDLAAQVISADGIQLGTFFRPNENRIPIDYESIPSSMIDALIATEDVRFYEHSGVDVRGTIRAILSLGQKGGASTITQQLAKQLFTGGSKSTVERILQKFQEWVIAIRLERQYTKRELLTMYLNKYDFSYQAIGVGSAARIYFGKHLQDLSIQESAVLVGMLKSSKIYNPQKDPTEAKKRRDIVLSQMYKYGYLSSKERDNVQKTPIELNFSPEGHTQGMATYFRAEVKKWMQNWIDSNPKTKKGKGETNRYDLYKDGLRIYVTVDSRMQQYAEEAVKAHISNLQKKFEELQQHNPIAPFRGISLLEREQIINQAMRQSQRWKKLANQGVSEKEIKISFRIKDSMRIFTWNGTKDTVMTPRDSVLYTKGLLQSGLLAVEPQTGYVKAWVGGIDYQHFKYDHVSQASRQVGSTFKPIVYATAMDQLKLSPCYKIPKARITIPIGRHGVAGEDWSPDNTDRDYSGSMTLKEALASSVNTIAARLMDQVGPLPIIRLARKLGIQSELQEVASIALGTESLKLKEMVYAYATFVNQGVYTQPIFVSRIEDKNGVVLFSDVAEQKDVISKEISYATLQLMEGVTQFGSGNRLRTEVKGNPILDDVVTGYPYEFTNPIAAKTGTTQNHSDGWFIGAVPNLCTGIWVGADNRSICFDDIAYGQGATTALPVWALFMKKCYADPTLNVSQEAFEVPEGFSLPLDCDTYTNKTPDELDWR